MSISFFTPKHFFMLFLSEMSAPTEINNIEKAFAASLKSHIDKQKYGYIGQLAKELGVAPSTVSNWARGARKSTEAQRRLTALEIGLPYDKMVGITYTEKEPKLRKKKKEPTVSLPQGTETQAQGLGKLEPEAKGGSDLKDVVMMLVSELKAEFKSKHAEWKNDKAEMKAEIAELKAELKAAEIENKELTAQLALNRSLQEQPAQSPVQKGAANDQ